MKSNRCPPACRSMTIASLSWRDRNLLLSEWLQKTGQSSGLFLAIPCIEMFYGGKNVWLNAIDLHCHSGSSAAESA